MDVALQDASAPSMDLTADIDPAVRFLSTLFAEPDTILIRPIETWNEAGKKCSRVDYKRTCYRRAVPALFQITFPQLFETADKERLNLFFGVCPRAGAKGRFDLAWQIRTAPLDQARPRRDSGDA